MNILLKHGSKVRAIARPLSARAYYFHLEPQQKNLDFPLNVGYNDHFKYHSQYLSVRIECFKYGYSLRALCGWV
jgi:hypothetical protein